MDQNLGGDILRFEHFRCNFQATNGQEDEESLGKKGAAEARAFAGILLENKGDDIKIY